jgi:hypothetical protein
MVNVIYGVRRSAPAVEPARRSRRAVDREVGHQKLLSTRICDLQLQPEGVLAECIEQVTARAARSGRQLHPSYYLG